MMFRSTPADPEMQSHIDACISKGRAEFEVFVLVCVKMFGKRPLFTLNNPHYLFDPLNKISAQCYPKPFQLLQSTP
jgi:hypothetical protein